MTSVLIFSDMDGSLLGFDDYRYYAVMEALVRLKQSRIPVILNTSKTLEELLQWRHRLDNSDPFVVENGSAIYLPESQFSEIELNPSENDGAPDGYRVEVLGRGITSLHEFIDRQQPNAVDFSRCDLTQAMELTGLDEPAARQAQQRRYSVPLFFTDPDDEAGFSQAAQAAGFCTLKGGRFLHLQGCTDKAHASDRLKQIYQQRDNGDYAVVAVGDGHNDLAMLEYADIAVVVASPASVNLHPANSTTLRTSESAPEGWVEGIDAALQLFQSNLEEKSDG